MELVGRTALVGTVPQDRMHLVRRHLRDLIVVFCHPNQPALQPPDRTIPSLTGLTNLETFDVGGNQLTGSIPSLTGLTNLSYFFVDGNQLTGTIPSLMGLTNLTYCSVSDNQLTERSPHLRPDEFELFLRSDNQLTGIPSLAGLTNLKEFDATDNLLTGTIPSLTG
jgi:Leucine-rich repeat (LRR) protein